ncbi:MAG: putative metal-binding motif-containing protein [Deltaproteobacteria bacterium]|nr:putative metal-binding motif-containing protein [Deltaproteobacteria bacterium]
MRQHALIASLLLVACGDKPDDGPIYNGETGDTYVPWPDDTAAGTDEDGDGFTVEDGDCDDADVYVNPGWPENEAEGNAADGKDNDCDGYVDESFRGLVVLQQGDGDDPARIVGVDDFGDTDWEVLLDDATLIPYFMAPGLEAAGSSAPWAATTAPPRSPSRSTP